MISDAQLCALASQAYSIPSTFTVAGDVHCVVTDLPDARVIAFRGTEANCLEDWLRDFDVVPVTDAKLGICHRGFLEGGLAAFAHFSLLPPTEKPVALTGHSLGGALAIVTAAELVLAGKPPAACVTFGAPAVAMGAALSNALLRVPGARYVCGDDPVPFVPMFPFRQDRPMTHVGQSEFDPIADHMIDRYAAALRAKN